MAVLIFVQHYMLGVMGASATEAGIASAIYSVPAFFLGPLVGRWIAKNGSVKGIIYLSSVFKIGSLLVLVALMFAQGADLSVWAVYACMLVSGIYQGSTKV